MSYKLNEPKPEYSPFSLIRFELKNNAPAGVFVGTCVDINIVENFTEKSYDGVGLQTNTKITFLFGFLDDAGTQFFVQSWPENFKDNPKANLMKFLKSWLNKQLPSNFEVANLIGEPATITVTKKKSASTGTEYSQISSIAPPFSEEAILKIPCPSEFELPGDRKMEIPHASLKAQKFPENKPVEKKGGPF